MAGPPDKSPRDAWPNVALFFSFYVLLVLMLGVWSRMLARRVAADNFHRNVRRFNQVMFAARVMVPVWFTVGVWGLGWGALVKLLGEGLYRSAAGMLLGTMPAFATWMGLWWSQYPAERALREQNLLVELDNDLPLYRTPAFRTYFQTNFQLQILFTLAPVAAIVLIRDLIMWTSLWWMRKPFSSEDPRLEGICSLIAATSVFLFAPALLARVLNTSPMPDSPLRRRLDGLCQRGGIRYRNILVWNTNNHVGNAAVMGVLPWLRYVLLSDVLLERMNDDEIEAVFAHELGHVVYRHMTWYAIFFIAMVFVAIVLGNALPALIPFTDISFQAISPAGLAASLLLFGVLSRRCERQADVYAARTMDMLKAGQPLASEALISSRQLVTVGAGPLVQPLGARETPVGEYGAWIFASALRRVASINNIPINRSTKSDPGVWNHIVHYADTLLELANNFMHGSIAGRIQYVQDLSADPRRTTHFDRTMFWIYVGSPGTELEFAL